MKIIPLPKVVVCALFLGALGGTNAAESPAPKAETSGSTKSSSVDMKKAEAEVETRYARAHSEIKEYVLWTARTFGPGRMWLPEDAFADLPEDAREKRIQHLTTLFNDAEYGRHLCAGLAEASALKDKRLVPGLMKVAGYQLEGRDYDCRAKWMAVAALARQESEEAVPLLIGLVDHGNQNTRNWARAALARKTGQDFKQDKPAWAKWWQGQGHGAIDGKLLKPSTVPSKKTAHGGTSGEAPDGVIAFNNVPISEVLEVHGTFAECQLVYSDGAERVTGRVTAVYEGASGREEAAAWIRRVLEDQVGLSVTF